MNLRLLFALVLLLSPMDVFAGSGTALLPSWFKDSSGNETQVFVTNVSSVEIKVKIRLFAEEGGEYNESSEPGPNFFTARGFSGDPLSSTGATLGPNQTGEFRVLGNGPTETGYGTIKWSAPGTMRVAIVAYARQLFREPQGISLVPVNNFQAF